MPPSSTIHAYRQFQVREGIHKKKAVFFWKFSKWGLAPPPPYFSEFWNRWGTFHISYGGHMGVIWGSYGGHMRIILSLMEVLWCHMGIKLEAYGGYTGVMWGSPQPPGTSTSTLSSSLSSPPSSVLPPPLPPPPHKHLHLFLGLS